MEHFHNFVTGALSGVTVDAVLYPIDSIKTNAQAKKSFSFSDIKKLYSGILPTLVGTVPASAFFYCFYELSKKLLTENRENISKTNLYLISTSVAEITACTVRVPFEIVKQRMQVSGNTSVLRTIYEVTQREGLMSFLGKSYFVMIVREIPFDCIQYFLWETLKEKAKKDFGKFSKKYPSITSAICGGLAGGIAGFLTTPLDVIKSRQIIYGKSYIETVTEIAEEGYMTFYRGCCFRSLYLFFGGLIFFGSLRFFSFKKE
ncbi:mitochondrial carrier protein, putative [Plasmodium knowlesi strain H]|uniref:Mitochondrial carrier protein, putative n=3 Tax=Plasmodium knowlesi TaxID=5850 RepID=A0A5K1V5R6_PLAKH|nr:mitochondrial carrier protein, putative [Plasmodium knowlesi strain H]OTN63885.1 putative Mitochondrial carrier protein [Plasmodium knowlesi]CAA9991204.1 mitochondrial carrier protein, putative [Plasmodium knowlesi strain H]SBO26262.1 mitochondrial carrier protein, putative [Plasmodium knowlesi strain H]SBO29411.1 mitochondrial carrier protein, putative [Plasmodium knowlesi strain H]VVS80678.1 mitochondrial carrier protein, putative [Plasmodium knowlesi strain H]|eukprot:XP_002262487.1 mitochondrial carrier protein, putative [Plasmodium knowlesi strain H]